MQPYTFRPGYEQLSQQGDGAWIAAFQVSTYGNQLLTQTSNVVTAEGIRVITFDIGGPERGPVAFQGGNCEPYTRGNETAVELVLYKGGGKKGHTVIYYP